MEPVSSVCAGINTLFRFGEYALRLMEVDDETGVFIRMIDVVRDDLRESERLLSLKHIYARLIKNPPKLAWVKKSLDNTKFSLSDIGKWVERARVEKETKRIEFKTRVLWVVKDHEKVTTRTKQLLVCHQQLSSVLTCLASLEHAEDESHMEDALRSPPSDLYELPISPPFITPPAYEAVVSSSKRETGPSLTFNDAPLPYPDDSLFNKTAISMPLALLKLGSRTTAKVHEYRYPSGFSVVELEGDSWMSKTNDSGSINPYFPPERIGPSAELHGELGLALSSYNRRKDSNALPELPGSMPVERLSDTSDILPSNPQYQPGQMLSPESHHDSESYRLDSCRALPHPISPTLLKGIFSPRFQFGHLFTKRTCSTLRGSISGPI
ncbi:hypothetical protein BS50DRAFT_287606 [Corynespora cassiicola Philippines]|uniref:Uncharacterized protein n=1 Tax=Corynespora cassiicola Philippines TaxID=1448308 RepID=A0A2T2N0Y1_CORCC|nr:hypothetical protein BS50DRAFT_287606 [Corynespora cassiicola Philippines]